MVHLDVPSFTGNENLAFWLSTEEPPKEFVYVIRAEGDTPIKVGRAVNVTKRLGSLQTGNPRKLELLHVMPGGSRLEWQLHHKLPDCRLVGEWFDGEKVPAFLDFVAGLSEWMVKEMTEAGELPSLYGYCGGWLPKGKGHNPCTVTFTVPQPLSTEEVQRNLWRREKERMHRVKMPDDFSYPKDDAR